MGKDDWIFTLPLENEVQSEKDDDGKSEQNNKGVIVHIDPPETNKLLQGQSDIIWGNLWAIFHFGFDIQQQKIILQALSFCDDWRQLMFFLGVYQAFAVKKVSDVSSHIPPTDKIANLVSIAIKNYRVQKGIMKYVTSAIAMVFSFLSPMVFNRLKSSENNTRAKLEVQSQKLIEKTKDKLLNVHSGHFMPIKWALHAVYEAKLKQEIDEKLVNTLINEINHLHTQCDRLINFKHEGFSWGLTTGVKISLYAFFVIGAIRQLSNGLEENHSKYILATALIINFLVFLFFVIILRCAEQIVKPYNDQHDVFELNRILDEKIHVASFVLNKENDLRIRMKQEDNALGMAAKLFD
ncbi:CLUMA_CG005265, isoform A [Clunio marinus]|uniref:Bestrophin homolog n=1 Tax=Clunio marinus TaxID=568069 RepID=A0A1J1HUD2_9DIPT|nr:CLUMA_CG005265, isoform A [Clunio marinus]